MARTLNEGLANSTVQQRRRAWELIESANIELEHLIKARGAEFDDDECVWVVPNKSYYALASVLSRVANTLSTAQGHLEGLEDAAPAAACCCPINIIRPR